MRELRGGTLGGFATLGLGLLGSLLSWLALPPLGLWPLAWAAPVPWLVLIRRRDSRAGTPTPCCGWQALPSGSASALAAPAASRDEPWLACTFRISRLLLAGVRGASPRGGACASHLVDHCGPLRLGRLGAGPVHLLTGINIATPGHSQYRWIELIQISDLAGGYAVSFVILFVAACLVRCCRSTARCAFWPLGRPGP